MNIAKLKKKFGLTFQNENLIKQAFTHSSYVNEHQKKHLADNERLEFLGDAVLELLVSDYLYHKYRDVPEGELTKYRASIVCEESLYYFAEQLQLYEFILLGKGEERTGGRKRQALLADVFEAFLGAIYIDAGIEMSRTFLEKWVFPLINEDVLLHMMDYKTALQELIQERTNHSLQYRIVAESGPSHARQFESEVVVNKDQRARGVGRTKKEAEQEAAKEMFMILMKGNDKNK